ncbi:MAG: energy transducer TonB [Verrucomicrobia bacterium]|jgi:TonB family protein|nr:energy transducer TonB [Verrucomicrobiota bacterium]
MEKFRSTQPTTNSLDVAASLAIPWRTRVGLNPLFCSIFIHACILAGAIWCGKILGDSDHGSDAGQEENSHGADFSISQRPTVSPRRANSDPVNSRTSPLLIPAPRIEFPTKKLNEPIWIQPVESENDRSLDDKSIAANVSPTTTSETKKSNHGLGKTMNKGGSGSHRGNDSKAKSQATTIAPKLITSSPPKYPRAALRKGAQGVAMVKVTVDPAGSVSSCTIWSSTGDQTLDEAALDTVKCWKFTPGHKGGPKVLVKVSFRLS